MRRRPRQLIRKRLNIIDVCDERGCSTMWKNSPVHCRRGRISKRDERINYSTRRLTPMRFPSTNSCGTEMVSAPSRSLISFCTSLLMNTSLSTNLTRWVLRICLTCKHRWYVSRTMPIVVVYSTTLPASFSCHVWNNGGKLLNNNQPADDGTTTGYFRYCLRAAVRGTSKRPRPVFFFSFQFRKFFYYYYYY